MNKREEKLFNSKTPEEYIDNSLRCSLPAGRKAFITKLWLEKRVKYTIEDIKRARNRHPFWKKKKMEGSLDRNNQRHRDHNYTRHGKTEIEWTEKTIRKFIDLNGKDAHGNYLNKDYQIAQKFSTTIPAIQHYRRKYNLVQKILEGQGLRLSERRVLDYIGMSEKILRQELKGAGKKR
jgi:hypothetical protein